MTEDDARKASENVLSLAENFPLPARTRHVVGTHRATGDLPPAALRVSLLYDTARDVQRVCLESGWRFCFIGGIAVQRWGEPRFTHDADLTVLTGFGSEASYIERLLGRYEPRTSGIPIDVSLGAIDFETRMIERASDWDPADGVVLTTCGADDLVVLKAFASRDQDWADIRNIRPARPASSTPLDLSRARAAAGAQGG